MAKADIQKILLTGEDRPDLYSVHELQADPETQKPQVKAEFHGVPINYPVDGGFEECDTTLLPEEVWEFEYVNRKNNFTSYFNDRTDPDNPTLASFEIINSQGVSRWINYKMYGITIPSVGVPDGNKIMYSDVFPNVDLEYIVDTWRLKENIIIKQPVEYYGYKFTLKLDENIVMEQQADGSIDFIDSETDERLWGIAKPYAKDAEDNRTDNVSYIIRKEIYNGVEYDSIEVVIEDIEFIQNAVFPIVLDPTTNYSISTGDDDGYVDGYGQTSYPPSVNRAITYDPTADAARSKYYDSGAGKYYYHISNSIMRFLTDSVPDDAVVIGGNLKITVGYKSTAVKNDDNRNLSFGYYTFSSITTSCYTTGISNNANAGIALSQFSKDVVKTIPLLNVSNINKTGYTGFRGTISGGTPSGENYAAIHSYNSPSSSYRPKLEVTYNVPPTMPTLLTPNGGEEYNESCSITWAASTDPEGDSITYHLQYSPNNGSNWYDIASGISGTTKYTNKIGTDGDCEAINKWNNGGTLDTTTKMFGSASIKNGYNWACYRTAGIADLFTVGKKYLISFYCRTVGSYHARLYIQINGGINITGQASSEWHRKGAKVAVSSINGSSFNLLNDGDGGTSWFDGIMVNEITDDEYNNLEVSELLEKYPHVSVKVLGYTWDTSSLAAGTQYRVKIRAYDGYGYSAYDQSDAVFTIKHITDQVNIGGELKEVDKRYVNIEGVLKEIDWIKVNVGGVLKDT